MLVGACGEDREPGPPPTYKDGGAERDAGRDGGEAVPRDGGEERDSGAPRDAGPPEPPQVVSAAPTEGAQGVPASTPFVSVVFDQSMDTAVVSASILITTADGGNIQSGDVSWTPDSRTASIAVSLLPSASVRIELADFHSAQGVQLDGVPVVGDGNLNFSTAP